MMKLMLCAGLVVAATIGATAGSAQAQLYPPFPGSYQTLYDLYPQPPVDLWGTARRDVAATPDCGAANPQGGVKSPATGYSCP